MKTSDLIKLRPSLNHTWNPITRTWDFPLSEAKKAAKERVNKKTSDKILSMYPLWKQNNMLARALELQVKGSDNCTAEELLEFDEIKAVWETIKELRLQSNIINTAIDTKDNDADIAVLEQTHHP